MAEVKAEKATQAAAKAAGLTKGEAPAKRISLEQQRAAQKCAVFVYLGPSLPKGALNRGAVLQGTQEQVEKHLAPQLEEYPQIKHLLVPADTLGASRAKVSAPGNYLHKCFTDVQGAADHKRKNREG